MSRSSAGSKWILAGVVVTVLAGGLTMLHAGEKGIAELFNKNLVVNMPEIGKTIARLPDAKMRDTLESNVTLMRQELTSHKLSRERGNIYLDIHVYLALLLDNGLTEREYTEWTMLYQNRQKIDGEAIVERVMAHPDFNKPNPCYKWR